MKAYIKVVVDDVAAEGVISRHRYHLICSLLKEGRICDEAQTWIERLCYGVSNNLLPLVD